MARFLMIAYTTYLHDGRVRRHAEALASRGDEIEVVSIAAGEPAKLNGVKLAGLSIPRYRGASQSSYLSVYGRFFARAAAYGLRQSRRNPFDAVIVCTMPDAAVISAMPCRLFGSRVLLDIHDTMPELYRDKFPGRRGAIGSHILHWEERLSAGLADHVLAVHEPHRMRLIRAEIPARKISVVANGPDPHIFGIERPAPPTDAGFKLVCHGTVAHRLGLDIAVRAVALLRDLLPDLSMLVIGDGDCYDDVVALTKQLGLERRIEFRGLIPTVDLPKALGDAVVGLVPQRATDSTHLMLPVKLLEYTTLGIPVIASRLSTIQHYFGPREVRFFEPENVESLADAIVEMRRNPSLRATMAARARAAGARLSWETQRQNFYRAVDQLSERREVTTWRLSKPL